MPRHRSSFGLLFGYSSGLERVTQAFDNALTCDVVLFHVVRANDEVNIGIAVLANGIVYKNCIV